MNPYQSSLYQLTESVGAVSMVSTDQIKKQENLDYLEHLCSFIERMNINPIWFQNQQPNNKLKILQIYQLAINYSHNLSQSYRKELQAKESTIAGLRKAEKDKVAAIRNQKEEYLLMKEKYKVKKHHMYKYMYDNLKNKIREQEEEREYRRQHQHRGATATATPEIVYYYPNDPNYHQNQQYPPNFVHQPSVHSQPGNPYQNQQFAPLWNPQSGSPTENMNSAANNPYFLDPNNRQQPSERGQTRPDSYRYNEFLNTGELQSGSSKIPQIITTKDVIEASQAREKEELEKSNIIDSGEKLIQKMGKEVKQNEKSINRSNASKKRESARLDSREDDDEFGDLTVNSKKRESIKAVEKNSDIEYDQEQFDSIAHIKLVSDSSAKVREVAPNRFQSKIQAASPRALQTTKNEPEVGANALKVQQSDGVKEMGFSTSIMHSKFSKNNKQAQQVQKMHQQPPKRNSQTIRKSNLPPEPDEIRQSNQSSKAKEATKPNQPERLNNNVRPKRNTQPRQEIQKSEEVSIVQTVDFSAQNFDIFNSNAGRVESKKFQKPKTQESVNILNSNVGYASGNSKAEPMEKLNLQKPKRASQIQSPILEVPEPTKSSANTLKVSVAESEQMRNSNMLYSQATSMKFSKEPSKTPPKLQKESAEKPEEEEQYVDDFDDIDDFQVDQLEQSHLPISNNKPKPAEKSQVDINISMVPTNKEIIKEEYLKLSNEVFELKNANQVVAPNKIGASVAASSNLGESDSFFDEILEIPMNSRIAKRPSVIHKFSPSKVSKAKTVESLKKIEEERVPSLSRINSPSIHIIDPTGNVQRVQQRVVKQQQKVEADKASKQNIKASIKLQEFSGKSVAMKGKQTSLLLIDPPEIKQEVQRVRIDEDQEINFNLVEKSNIGNNSYQRQGGRKILDLINKIETQSPTIKDARTFNDSIFDRILKDRMKVGANTVKTKQKWEEVQTHFKKELEKVKSELEERRNEERSEEVSTPNSRKKESFYDDLVYSQSNAKFQEKSAKKEQLSIDPVRELTESITIKDPPVIQEKPAKNAADNKYSRSNKPKVQIKNQIRKNINEGKNAYDVDDPLNVAVYQNKGLLENRQEDQDSDF